MSCPDYFTKNYEFVTLERRDYKSHFVSYRELSMYVQQLKEMIRLTEGGSAKVRRVLDNFFNDSHQKLENVGGFQENIEIWLNAIRKDLADLNAYSEKKMVEFNNRFVYLCDYKTKCKQGLPTMFLSLETLERKTSKLFADLDFHMKYLELNRQGVKKLVTDFLASDMEILAAGEKLKTEGMIKPAEEAEQRVQEKEEEQEFQEYLKSNKSKDSYRQMYSEFLLSQGYSDLTLYKNLRQKIVLFYSNWFCNGELEHGQAKVERFVTRSNAHNESDTFKLGLYLGIMAPFALLIFFLFFSSRTDYAYLETSGFIQSFPVFRGVLLFMCFVWLHGMDVLVWTYGRLNYIYIFNFKPYYNLSWVKVFKSAGIVTICWLVVFFFYLVRWKEMDFSWVRWIDPIYFNYSIYLFSAFILMMPLHIFHWQSRKSMMKIIWTLIISPFGENSFLTNFVADLFCSMTIPLGDLEYALCGLGTDFSDACIPINNWGNSFMAFIPYFWRLTQCLRWYYNTRFIDHLLNAGKYLVSIFVILINAFHVNLDQQLLNYFNLGNYFNFNWLGTDWGPFKIMWLFFVIVSTAYSFAWDVLKDWKILQRDGHFPYRRTILFPRWTYLVVIVFNFFGRMAWVATLITAFYSPDKQWYLTAVFAFIEMFRRAVWGFFRLEMVCSEEMEKNVKHNFPPLKF